MANLLILLEFRKRLRVFKKGDYTALTRSSAVWRPRRRHSVVMKAGVGRGQTVRVAPRMEILHISFT
jgi:hypothetical protein